MIWNFEKHADNTAFLDEYGNKMTYGQLEEFGKDLAVLTGGRSLVFVLCSNSIGSAAGYAGFVQNGIVPLLLNAHMDQELRDTLINNYQPKFIWAPEEMEQDCIGEGHEKIYSGHGYSLIKTSFVADYPIYDELCLMLTTSGSTGSPKFVRQSYKNVESNARAIVEYLRLESTERPISTLPMNYTYGLSIINSHLLVGATILLTDKGLMQKEFWNFFNEERATSFGGVPYTYEMLEKLRFNRRDLPSLRYMTQAGGKLTPELHKKFSEYCLEKGYKFIVMYGQCEATARMGYLPWEKSVEKNGSMGIAIPGGKFTLIDTEGNGITAPEVAGELVYEGDNVTLGYAEGFNDLAKEDERGGILHTGDVAQFDQDGYYYIVGRMKRFLKIYGNRVNLDEIDRMIKAEFDNIDVASAGIDDHMYIFLTDEVKKDAVRKFVIDKTKLNPSAFTTIVLDEIPKNDSGKIMYKELEKYYK